MASLSSSGSRAGFGRPGNRQITPSKRSMVGLGKFAPNTPPTYTPIGAAAFKKRQAQLQAMGQTG